MIVNSSLIFSQIREEYRHQNQFYIQDSANVYWTHIGNPFSPPTIINEKMKGLFCGSNTFYCDLSDSVLVAIKNEKDSILYSQYVYTKNPPNFHFCTWIAGSQIDRNELPKSYYQFDDIQKIKIVLMIDGNDKCYQKWTIKDKRYYWIQNNRSFSK